MLRDRQTVREGGVERQTGRGVLRDRQTVREGGVDRQTDRQGGGC